MTKKIISYILVVLWALIIFNFSAMDTNESNSKSIGIISKVIEISVKITNKVGITNIDLSNNEKLELANKLNYPLRKVMHASVYFILAFLLLIAFKHKELIINKNIILSLIICFIFACTDEYHQTFVNGRTGLFSDVLIDFSGSIIGTFIFYIINRHKYK